MAGNRGRRGSWDSLNPTYRRRLERRGITGSGYESGASLAGARGHARTPERPDRADRRPDYAAYRARRDKAMRVVTTEGVQVLSGMTSADRSKVGSHDHAVGRYLRNGGIGSRLPGFEGVTVTGYSSNDGYKPPVVVTLETDVNHLHAEERSGNLDFKSIYEKAA